jgi:PmbA protein
VSQVVISQDVIHQSERFAAMAELDRLAELAEDVIRRARAAGASQAEVAASIDSG